MRPSLNELFQITASVCEMSMLLILIRERIWYGIVVWIIQQLTFSATATIVIKHFRSLYPGYDASCAELEVLYQEPIGSRDVCKCGHWRISHYESCCAGDLDDDDLCTCEGFDKED